MILDRSNRVESAFLYGDRMLVLFSKQVRVKLPVTKWDITWRRPSAVWIQNLDGSEKIVRIHDTTRKTILLVVGGVIMGAALFGFGQFLDSKSTA